jgi:alpha-soluble NSF attachment protein
MVQKMHPGTYYIERLTEFLNVEPHLVIFSTANACLIKVATLSAELKQYDRAIGLFEQVATASINNNLLRFSVKDYLLRASICHLCVGDWVSARRAIDNYTEMDTTFNSTSEYEFVKVSDL